MKTSRYHGQFGIEFSKIHEDRELAYVVPLRYKIIAVVVGLKFSGKTIITDHLVEDLGFRLYSLSKFVRDEVDRLSLSPADRAILKEYGDKLRRQHGRDYLARRIVQSIRRDLVERQEAVTHVAVDGIKNAGEIEFLKRLPDLVTIGVVADDELRRNRAEKDGEFTGTGETFASMIDAPDCNPDGECGQQVDQCMYRVRYTVSNNSTKNGLRRQIDEILKNVGGMPRDYDV